jgi:hypothetical protein
MAIWTLKHNGTEHSFPDWGIVEGWTATFVNKAKSVVSFRTTEDFDAGAPQFTSFPAWFRANPTGSPASQRTLIYKNRTTVGSGGSIYFAGYFGDPRRVADGEKQYLEYSLYDVLWLCERNPFKQHRNQFNGWSTPGDPGSGATTIDVVTPEVYLGENLDGTRMVQREQLAEVIDWMNESYNPTKRGATSSRDDTKDVILAGTLNPKAYCIKNRLSTVFCLETMNSLCRFAPDAIYQVDHTTTPPTLNILTMAKWNYATDPPTFVDYTNLPEVTLTITAQQEREISLAVNNERRLPGVIIYYMTSDTVDSVTVPVTVKDDFPVGTSDFYPEVPSHVVTLEGSNVQNKTCTPQVEAIADAESGTLATRVAWWKKHKQDLKDPKIDAATISVAVASITDDAGTAIDLAAYPNELKKPLPEWVKTTFDLHVKRAHVKAAISFARYTEDGHLTLDIRKKEQYVTCTIQLTDAEATEYSAVAEFDPGETVPAGVAESVYRAVNIAMGAGSVTFVDAALRSDVYIGCRLKLIGPTTTFTDLLVQEVKATPDQGLTQVKFGPSAAVDADALIELARATRFRNTYRMPSGRESGMGGAGGETDFTMDAPSENSVEGVGAQDYDTVTADQEEDI